MVGKRTSRPACAMAVVPRPDLLAMVKLLGEPRLYGVLSGEGLTPAEVRDLGLGLGLPLSVRRPLHPLLSRHAVVHTMEVDDYHSKNASVSEVARLAAAHGLGCRAVEAVEQALDEMLLNALYDAPVDADGQQRYRHYLPGERTAIRAPLAERAVVRCAGDDQRFVVAVRDRFGSLRRRTVLAYLARCAQARLLRQDPLLPRPGGAGVGLYLIAMAATELLFRLHKDRRTEVVYAISTRQPRPVLRALVVDDRDDRDVGECGPGLRA